MMNQPSLNQDIRPFPLLRALLVLSGAMAVGAALLWLGLYVAGLEQHAWLNVAAAGVCWAAGLAGLAPVWLAARSHPHGAGYGFMAGIVVRMFVAGAVVILALWVWKLPYARPLSLWIGCWYLLALLLDVALVSSHVRRLPLAASDRGHGEAPPSETRMESE